MTKLKRLTTLVLAVAMALCLGVFIGLNVNDAKAEEPIQNVFVMEEGVSIRYNATDPGLRFIVKMSEDVKEKAVAEGSKLGFIISLTQYFDGVTDDFINITPKLDVESLVVPAEKIYKDGDYYYANGVVGSMLEKNLTREYSCVAYIYDGTDYIYADYSAEENSRSWQEIASEAFFDLEDFKDQTDYGIFGSFDLPIIIDNEGYNTYSALVELAQTGFVGNDLVFKLAPEVDSSEALPETFKGVIIEDGDFITFEKVGDVTNGLESVRGGDASLVSYEISNEWAKNGTNSLKAVFNKANFVDTTLAGSKWRGQLYIDTWDPSVKLGLPNAYVGKDAAELWINASESCSVIFDVGSWSKVYLLSKGENHIIIKSSDMLSGSYDFSSGNYLFSIDLLQFNDEKESGEITLYVDAFKYINSADLPQLNCPEYTPVDGDFLTFETVNGTNNGIEIIRGGNAGLASYELSNDWAKNGTTSLKAVFNKSTFTDTSLAGASWRGILYVDAYYDKLGLPNAFDGKDAVEFWVYASEACDIIIDVMKSPSEGGNWSKVYHLDKGENKIVLKSNDTLSGSNDFTEGSSALNINVLSFETVRKAGAIVLYLDAFKYIDSSEQQANPEYTPVDGDFLTFDTIAGSNNGLSDIQGGNSGLVSYEISDAWAKNGSTSLKAVFNKANFAETSLAGSVARGVLFIGALGSELGLANAYEGKNAVKFYVKASEACTIIIDVMKNENEGGNWSKTYNLVEGENEIILTASDTLSGTNDFTQGSEQLNINVLSFAASEGLLTLYLDAFSYISVS